MKRVFADTSYWVALSHPSDSLHNKAHQVSERLGSVAIVTSDMILVELLNHMSKVSLRGLALQMVKGIKGNRNVEVVPQKRRQLEDATTFYSERLDKNWSVTDCASFQIMRKMEIHEVLTHDHNFEQAGFSILL